MVLLTGTFVKTGYIFCVRDGWGKVHDLNDNTHFPLEDIEGIGNFKFDRKI